MSNFDITQYKWSDDFINVYESETNNEVIRFDNNMYMVDIEKRDAIAIARHFKITSEDIKQQEEKEALLELVNMAKEDIENGRTKPVEDVMKELKEKYLGKN